MSVDELRAKVATGLIGKDTFVWRAGLKEWARAEEVAGLLIPGDSAQSFGSDPDPLPEASPKPEAVVPVASGEAGKDLILAGPWQRFWARAFDNAFQSFLVGIMVGVVWPSAFSEEGLFRAPGSAILLNWILLPVVVAVDAVVYAIFGNTLGKWIAGIRVRTHDDGRVRFGTYLKRNFGMYWSGLGTGFPIVVLFALARSYGRVNTGELVSWDEANDTRCVATSTNNLRVWLIGVLYIGLLIIDRVV